MPAIKINSQALKDYLAQRDMKFAELSEAMGRTPSFVSAFLRNGSLSAAGYKALCNTLGVSYGTFKEDNTPSPTPSDAYRLNLIYSDSKVLVQLMRGEEEVVAGAWAIVKEQSHLGFIQAISYAAHMMYKFAEQKELDNKESA